MCSTCHEKLTSAHDFMNLCQKSDNYLKNGFPANIGENDGDSKAEPIPDPVCVVTVKKIDLLSRKYHCTACDKHFTHIHTLNLHLTAHRGSYTTQFLILM